MIRYSCRSSDNVRAIYDIYTLVHNVDKHPIRSPPRALAISDIANTRYSFDLSMLWQSLTCTLA